MDAVRFVLVELLRVLVVAAVFPVGLMLLFFPSPRRAQ
jgi:hypothetical protein